MPHAKHPKVIFVTIILIALPLAAGAFFFRVASDVPLVVNKDQIVQGDYVTVGETVDLQGNIDGDVIVAAQRLIVAGAVSGDVIAAANEVTITGEVEGDVRVAAMRVTLGGTVEKNLNVWAQAVTLPAEGKVGRNAYVVAQAGQLNGAVGGQLAARAHQLGIAGTVQRDARVEILGNGTLQLSPTAKFEGNLTYLAQTAGQLQRDAAATVGGKVTHEGPPPGTGAELWRWLLFGRIISLFGLMVVGLVLVSLVPRYVVQTVDRLLFPQAWLTLAVGLIGAVATPVLAVVLLFTIIGIPLGLILGVGYVVGLYLGQVLAAIALGVLFFRSVTAGKYRGSLLAPMVVGATAYVAIASFGPIGWIVKILAVLWGFGALLRMKGEQLAQWR